MISAVLDNSGWRFLTNRKIYKSYMDNFPVTKVEREAASPCLFNLVWQRVNLSVLTSDSWEICFLLIHMKLPVPERLFRIGVVMDPYCLSCMHNIGAVESNSEHFFCECLLVCDVWTEIRNTIVQLEPTLSNTSNLDLITLKFKQCENEKELVWIIGSYLAEVWRLMTTHGQIRIQAVKVFGFLKFKYKLEQHLKMIFIPTLAQ